MNWKNIGGFPTDPAFFIGNATDEYNQKKDRSRKIVERSLKKYRQKRQKRKKYIKSGKMGKNQFFLKPRPEKSIVF